MTFLDRDFAEWTADPAFVQKASAYISLPDEAIVDYGLGTPEDQLAASTRILLRLEAQRAAWDALPLRTRLYRRHIYPAYADWASRIAHAWSALRGVSCEDD